jgi:hypothetical protein
VRHYRIRRDDNDGYDTVYRDYHRCKAGAKEENDVLEFWPHYSGKGLPAGVPFVVRAECPACHEWVPAMFEWSSNLIIPT